MFLTNWIAWVQVRLPVWFTGNSWINEPAAGLAGAGSLSSLVGPFWALVIFTIVSLSYEAWVDPSRGKPGHNPFEDSSLREAGALLAVVIWTLICALKNGR